MNPVELELYLFESAIETRATDIHVEPREMEWVIRFRIDGHLVHFMSLPIGIGKSLIQRIKVQAKMEISETRKPQDGSYMYPIKDDRYDVRVSVLPTVEGEKIVLRILYQHFTYSNFRLLGMKDDDVQELTSWLEEPMGMILFAGSTGAGKTTTMYAVIQYLNKEDVNICTIEDPVEVRLKGINQVQVNEVHGITFANGLRSILRQDPDIIVVGEIRDRETAEIAIRASLSGHLVLATVHSSDAASAITRFLEMGIEPYLIASALKGIVFQRMIFIPCIHCEKNMYCAYCNGRGVMKKSPYFDLMKVHEEMSEYILNKRPPSELRSVAKDLSRQISIPL